MLLVVEDAAIDFTGCHVETHQYSDMESIQQQESPSSEFSSSSSFDFSFDTGTGVYDQSRRGVTVGTVHECVVRTSEPTELVDEIQNCVSHGIDRCMYLTPVDDGINEYSQIRYCL